MIIYQQVKNLNIYLSKPLFINDVQKVSTVLVKRSTHQLNLISYTNIAPLLFDRRDLPHAGSFFANWGFSRILTRSHFISSAVGQSASENPVDKASEGDILVNRSTEDNAGCGVCSRATPGRTYEMTSRPCCGDGTCPFGLHLSGITCVL